MERLDGHEEEGLEEEDQGQEPALESEQTGFVREPEEPRAHLQRPEPKADESFLLRTDPAEEITEGLSAKAEAGGGKQGGGDDGNRWRPAPPAEPEDERPEERSAEVDEGLAGDDFAVEDESVEEQAGYGHGGLAGMIPGEEQAEAAEGAEPEKAAEVAGDLGAVAEGAAASEEVKAAGPNLPEDTEIPPVADASEGEVAQDEAVAEVLAEEEAAVEEVSAESGTSEPQREPVAGPEDTETDSPSSLDEKLAEMYRVPSNSAKEELAQLEEADQENLLRIRHLIGEEGISEEKVTRIKAAFVTDVLEAIEEAEPGEVAVTDAYYPGTQVIRQARDWLEEPELTAHLAERLYVELQEYQESEAAAAAPRTFSDYVGLMKSTLEEAAQIALTERLLLESHILDEDGERKRASWLAVKALEALDMPLDQQAQWLDTVRQELEGVEGGDSTDSLQA